VRAVDAVLGGAVNNAFCAIRPPGHHATTGRAMGFCLFNNAAMAARHARQVHGLERVAIVDFDVHHGNGTQEIFWRDPSVLYASTHQMPHYPGSGAASETGAGNIVNAPLAAGDGSGAFDAAMKSVILPALERFEPELVIVSAGFDAHRADPLSSTLLEEEDYYRVTGQLCSIATKYADGRLVSLLEGGYHLQALASSAAAHVRALMQA
jgi:acetoin utilization deacetylase AcuC-like enzyme